MSTLTHIQASGFAKYFSGRLGYVWHVVFWLLYSADELLSLAGVTAELEYGFWGYLIYIAPIVALAYVNLGFLVPRYLQNGKFGRFFFGAVGIALVYPLVMLLVEDLIVQIFGGSEGSIEYVETFGDYLSYYIYLTLEMVFILGTTTSLKLFKALVLAQKRIQTLENKKLQAELDFLKAQINPHFLFNSINNIYVLTRVDPKKASETILKFSDLLSYQLYDCAKPEVSLRKEVEYLRNFLDLQRIRKENASISFEVTGEPNGIMIPPFLFITFVENAVKHGNSLREDGYIEVKMAIQDKEIEFMAVNSKGEPLPESESSGLGLENARRRLDLMYPGKHRLLIEDMADSFAIQLNIKL